MLAGAGRVLLAGTGHGEVLAFSWPPPPLGQGEHTTLCIDAKSAKGPHRKSKRTMRCIR